MSRLTRKIDKLNNKTIYGFYEGYDDGGTPIVNMNSAIHKLGKIEDLMEKYKINSIEEFENILIKNSEELHVIQGIKYGMGGAISIVGKGMLYNILSEELGCPLKVVFKALKDEKIYFEDGTYSTDFVLQKTPAWAFAIYDNLINNKEIVIIKDYKKTWWLKGEKNE